MIAHSAIDMDDFISKEEFERKVEKQKELSKVTAWRDLRKWSIFKVILIERCRSEVYGDCHLLHFKDTSGELFRAWAPVRMIAQINEKRKPEESVYFTCLGFTKINATKTRNDFELTFHDHGKGIVQGLFQDAISANREVSGNC